MRLEAAELARWIRFAAKGGIGKCTATTDCVAESEDDLMFLKDDEITVLLQIADREGQYLGYCEGVVGRFNGSDVQFHGKLKKAVITKRSSVSASSTKSPSPGPPSRPGSSALRIQAQIPAGNTDQRHPPSLSFSSASGTSDSAVSTPAIAQFPSHPQEQEIQTRYVPSPLNLASEPTSPLRIAKKIPTSPPPVPDTSYSTFDDHAARLDIGNDTEVGIGLSLLQGLVGDDDSDDDSDYGPHNTNRDSVSGSQEGTVEGLDYAKPEQHLSPVTSPTSPNFPPERERRPSLAASTSAASSSSWEGASDIYDNYRYSRYSVKAASERTRTDSLASARPRTDSNRSTNIPKLPDDKQRSNLRDRTMSVDSDASVYTRDSRLSSLSKDARQLLSQVHELPQSRPTPLQEPLLNTHWGSPVSSPAISEPKSSSALHTPIPGQVPSFEAALGLNPAPKSPPPPLSPGLASVVRQRVEKRLSDDTIHRHSGLGTRIVVEDDEELPSRVALSDSPDPDVSTSTILPPVVETTPSTPPARPRHLSEDTVPDASPRPSRVSLADLREPGGPVLPGSSQRQSLFLPHPNAPKPPPPTQASRGPMYIQQANTPSSPPPRPSTTSPAPQPVNPALDTRLGGFPLPPASFPPAQMRPNVIGVMRMALSRPPLGFQRGPTIYGRTECDLVSSTGPVPIIWSVDPPAASAATGPGVPQQAPPQRPPPPPGGMGGPQGAFPPLGPGLPSQNRSAARSASLSVSGPVPVIEKKQDLLTPNAPLPRANFAPKTPGARPRSRSFSSFNSSSGTGSNASGSMSDPEETKKTLTAIKSSPLRPSPLSLPQNVAVKPPSSPLAQPSTIPPSNSSLLPSPGFMPNLAGRTLRHSSSRATLTDVSSVSSITKPARLTLPTNLREGSVRAASPESLPPPTPRDPSMRTKLSLPNLRRKQSKPDDADHLSLASPIQESALSPAAEMLQVQDMEFELVRPTGLWNQAARSSEDSNILGREASIDALPSPCLPPAVATPPASASVTGGFLRPESPAISVSSGGHASVAPSVVSSFAPTVASGSKNGTDTEASVNASSMEAHRARELKWLTLISSSPASTARKNKKVKKLIMEGVPGSVRYPVWSYLTDGKAKCVPGVYEQLCKRGKVSHSADIERDVERCFVDQTHLHGTKGGVVTLLQAYLNMVPDVQYMMSLTLIVGQLALLAPEEEAFWIFVSVMDTHIRPYFSTSTLQMEVDASLFAKALEANDGQVGEKVLMELSIDPVKICERWFTTVFVGVLPQEYVCRVWDHFLYEGVPFLMRIGLAVMTCLRQRILSSPSEDSLLSILHHPQPAALPSSPDAFISLAYSFKLKDDDVRKQRVKLEAQLKRQTQQTQQVPRTGSSGMGISLPR